MPVWEEQQLGNFSHGYPPQMPFQAPLRAASHSALYLSIDAGGDQLVGRAENGKPAFKAVTLYTWPKVHTWYTAMPRAP